MIHQHYEQPRITDFGKLEALTADVGHFGIGVGGVAGGSLPQAPPGGGSDIGPTAQELPEGDVLGGGGGAGGGEPGGSEGGGGGTGGAGAGGGSGGGGGGSLPFTGLALGLFAAIGGGLTAAGTALRRALRRR
jgi:hypothetical protein